MNDQFVLIHALALASLTYEFFGQLGALPGSHHPADHVAAIDIGDYIEVIVIPFLGTAQLGDVPRPHLVGTGGKQFRLLVLGMACNISTLLHLSICSEDSIHSADRANVPVFIKQRCIDLPWRFVHKSWLVQNGQYLFSFART